MLVFLLYCLATLLSAHLASAPSGSARLMCACGPSSESRWAETSCCLSWAACWASTTGVRRSSALLSFVAAWKVKDTVVTRKQWQLLFVLFFFACLFWSSNAEIDGTDKQKSVWANQAASPQRTYVPCQITKKVNMAAVTVFATDLLQLTETPHWKTPQPPAWIWATVITMLVLLCSVGNKMTATTACCNKSQYS